MSDEKDSMTASDTTTHPVRTRFAPSPTGFPHIGNYRTALYAWLLARHHGGQFVLRIEDTDRARYVPGSLEAIMEGLRWLGLTWDEGPDVGGAYGPYTQSERLDIYRERAEWLVEHGHAYYCYCTEERLEQLRAEQTARKEPTGYDRYCRHLSADERAAREAEGLRSVVRFAVPLEGETVWRDALRGEITVQNRTLDDMVLLKSDGYPTYNFANIVDDHLMAISHVIRGEEYIPSAPRYAQVYRAFGWEEPEYVHVGLILSTDRQKLSKRHGALPLLEYRDEGYLPEAVVNFLATLGWAYDGQTDIFTLDEAVQAFTLERIGVSPSVFDRGRLDWMNGVYIRALKPEELVERALPFLLAGLPEDAREIDREYAARVIALDQERLKTLADAPRLTAFFFVEQPVYDPALLLTKGLDAEHASVALEVLIDRFEALEDWSHEALLATLDGVVTELGFIRTKSDGTRVPDRAPIFMLVRVAISGRKETPGLPETLAVLGKARALKRLKTARARLQPAVV
jgi:glutamyl-tRNA synthetase